MKSFRSRMGIAAAALALAVGAMPEEADAALANALGGARASPRIRSTNPRIRRQQVIADPEAGDPLAGSGALAMEAIRIDFEGEFTDLPPAYTADDLVFQVSIEPIAPFTFLNIPTITFSGNRMFVDDLFVRATPPPPPGAVDFADITLDFDTVLADPLYNQIDATYRFVLDENSFIQATDGTTSRTFGPTEIDVSQTASENLGVPEPSAAMLGLVATGLGLARRRRRRRLAGT